jgi:plasmid stabilization system protein ParE
LDSLCEIWSVRLRYRRTALAQLDRIFADIAHDNPAVAGGFIVAIRKRSIDLLADFPYGGRTSQVPDIRELPVVRFPYIVFHSVNDAAGDVVILRIRHTSRDPTRHLDQQ